MAAVSDERVFDFVSSSAAETQRLGSRLGELAYAGDVYCLEGELGAGKTCFVQGLGRGLHVPTVVHSPTFILASEHRGGRLPLYHLDVYRVQSAEEAIGFGLEDYYAEDGVCVIEWAEKIRSALPVERLWIAFRHVDESTRGLTLSGTGVRYRTLVDELRQVAGTNGASANAAGD